MQPGRESASRAESAESEVTAGTSAICVEVTAEIAVVTSIAATGDDQETTSVAGGGAVATTAAVVETTSTKETTSVSGEGAGLTATEITTTRDASPVLPAQPASTPQETRRKHFQHGWLSVYPWLRYDRAKDQMFCHLCREVKHHNTMSIGTGNFRTQPCHVMSVFRNIKHWCPLPENGRTWRKP